MDESEMTDGAAVPAQSVCANSAAAAVEMEQTEALREAFCKGWDSALSYRQEHGEARAEKDGAPAAEVSADHSAPAFVDDPITREIHERAERAAARETLLDTIMGGTDLASWIAPKESVVSDELLAEHLSQLGRTVRYALSFAFDGHYGLGERLSAANTATRMIRTNIALTKALDAKNAKTVRGGRRARRTQD
jgi:hypothetical protein